MIRHLVGVVMLRYQLCSLATPPRLQIGCAVVNDLDGMRNSLRGWPWLTHCSQPGLQTHQLARLLFKGCHLRIPASQTRIEAGSPSGCSTIEADVDSGQPLNSSDPEAAVINTRIGALAGKRGVHRVLPAWAQPGHRIRCATSLASNGVKPLCLFAEHAVGIDRACG